MNQDIQSRRSINAEADVLQAGALSGYIVTAMAREFLARLGAARAHNAPSRCFTLTGPYGTGKSAFAVLAAQLFSPASWPGRSVARDVLRDQANEVYEDLFTGTGSKTTLLPVVATGAVEPLESVIRLAK